MNYKLHIWRQENADSKGRFEQHEIDVSEDTSFLEMLDALNEQLIENDKDAIAFVYPSLYEGFGIPPLEAMAHQCPVVSSNSSSMPEVIGRASEYFDPKEPENIKVAIENVVFSQSRIRDLKAKGLEQIQVFSWQKCAKETLAIYKDMVG
mgnify:CR=1 FL=1